MKIKTILPMSIIFSIVFFFSQSLLADPYSKGYNAAIGNDYSEAAQHWGPLATEGYPEAQFNIAMMYHKGLGVPYDEVEAVKWYHKSAESGHAMAQEYLAVAYAEGWFGLPKDLKKSEYWLNKAEQQQFHPGSFQ